MTKPAKPKPCDTPLRVTPARVGAVTSRRAEARKSAALLPPHVARVVRAAVRRYEAHDFVARAEGDARCYCPLCPHVRAYLKAEARRGQ